MVAASPLILLTGATGFVGRQILRALGDRRCRVRAVVRDGKQGQVADKAAVGSTVVSPDIFAESASWWSDVCDGVDTVIHAAWYVEPEHLSAIAEKSGMSLRDAANSARGSPSESPAYCRDWHSL